MNIYNKSDIPVDLQEHFCPAEIGLEQTPDAYVAELVTVFREVRRVLREDGTLWLNLGDSYTNNSTPGGGDPTIGLRNIGGSKYKPTVVSGLPAKNLIGIPWRVAFALQADGWFLRQDIIWHKPNPMPESVTDRCTKAHEYVFLMSKSASYHCDMEAIAEPVTQSTVERLSQSTLDQQKGSARVPGKTNGNMKAVGRGGKNAFRGQGHMRDTDGGPANRDGRDMRGVGTGETRNKRSVWTVNTRPYKEAHFATFPPSLIRPMILAGCPQGGTVLDPFGGSGTTGEVSEEEGRNAVLIELNPAYIKLQEHRTAQMGLFCAQS